jgi:FixJ family two-component response regulator
VSSAEVSPKLVGQFPEAVGADPASDRTPFSVALIGPDEDRRLAVGKAMAESRRASVREFDSYPPELDNLKKLLDSFDVIVLDLDSDPTVALELVERASAGDSAIVIVYSEQIDHNLAVHCMRAGAREFLLLPIEQSTVTEALDRTGNLLRQKSTREPQQSKAGTSETRTLRPRLELASSNAANSVQQEKKKSFELRGYGRSFEEVLTPRTMPTIKWPTPEPITYRDTLTSTQLNATASVPGSFVYTPGPGYMLPAGAHTLWVTFTPADHDGEPPLQASVSIVVGKATPALSWPIPDEITNGIALDHNQLNATASVPGTFDYSPAVGEVLPPGTHKLSVTFTPADSANYSTAQVTMLLNVAREKPVIEWSKPDPITYGTLLSDLQLSATTIIPGQLEFTPGAGSLLAAGEHTLSVVFTPADTLNYSQSKGSVSLIVAKATPFITWPTPDPLSHGAALVANQLNARATVPGSFAYTPAEGEILPPGVHRLSATLTPTDTLNYTAAHAIVTLTVTEKSPALINWPVPAVIPYGTALGAAQLNATASVQGTFAYSPSAGHVLAPGRYTLSVLFTPFDMERYAAARAGVVLEVAGLPGIPSSPVASTQTLNAFGSAPANPIMAESTSEQQPHETRTYKGAVYEKGDDGKWHLQQN